MKRDNCRCCGSNDLTMLHNFGAQPLAGLYPSSIDESLNAERFELDFTLCKKCGLLQVTNLPPINKIFNDDYRYSSSTIPYLVDHFSNYSNFLKTLIKQDSTILEFGCNDGVFLYQLAKQGFKCVGIDASNNVAEIGRAKGLDIKTGFMTPDFVSSEFPKESFDVITCSNVFAHIDNLNDVMTAIDYLLKKEGLFCVEVHDSELIFSENQFDTIYHEHLTYFTQDTLSSYLERTGFTIIYSAKTAMHGGGLRIIGKKNGRQIPARTQAHNLSRYLTLNVSQMIDRARENILFLYQKHGSLIGYGAAGRSQMFINFTNTEKYFDIIYDDSPLRQDRYIAGTGIPIHSFSKTDGEALVILAWNYAEQISCSVGKYFSNVYTVLPSLKRHINYSSIDHFDSKENC